MSQSRPIRQSWSNIRLQPTVPVWATQTSDFCGDACVQQLPVLALVPAYNPDETLLRIVAELVSTPLAKVVLVNDGSMAEKEAIFLKIERDFPQVTVLKHGVNLGKGAALKTGLNHCLITNPLALGVVTLDADGQHLIPDVVRVAEELVVHAGALVLGVRTFSKNVPLRSRFGNILTVKIFKIFTGVTITDTQTGLRGIPMSFIRKILCIHYTGYEFELDMLIRTRREHMPIRQVPIETVYIDDNCSSHFNPFLDSLKIYMVFVRYISVAFLSFLIDYLIFIILIYFFQCEAWVLYFFARIFSSTVNFLLNKYVVFQSQGKMIYECLKYLGAMVYVLALSTVQMYTFNTVMHMPAMLAKPLADGITFILSFFLLNIWVFGKRHN
ncbi:conserved membrane hypothetical protein [Desulfovibrionales bacterium]